jgi:LacI family transcriptional regulator
MSEGAPTLKLIAERAGVSIATASRVARGIGQVSPETRTRVLTAIEMLGYQPDHAGRALVNRRRAALGIVLPGTAGPYYADVISGFERETVSARLGMLILGTHLIRQVDDLALEMAGRVDGIAIFGGALPDAVVQRIAARGVAVVMLAQPPVDGIPAVRVDNVAPTAVLTRHLIEEHGYTPLAFLGSPEGSPDVGERWAGFQAGHRQLGLEPPTAPLAGGMTQADGARALDALLQRGDLPRALVCANDELALGVLTAARIHGLRVPDDLALTGWDNIHMGDLVAPSLTTVHQPIAELGAVAARMLLALIEGRSVSHDTLLPTTNIYRESCGCSRRPASAGATNDGGEAETPARRRSASEH